ncbi:hypothetical protein MUK42_17980 [Musa troglodytarum]|uniref:Drought induced 19 protein type zinc-binding domain-containing protein n=1 Tax=Musa troglodytarum TaxID=320322 RepID=A0A9E7L6W6_9LILI|nr:hypothetical protein MUK42_17980 [Musa troglodytarum]
MDPDAWSRFSAAASKRHQSAPQSRYADASRDPNLRGWRDLYLGFEELDGGEDDPRAEFPCPFCSEDFDIVGLCCHIDDEHPVEAKNGVIFVVILVHIEWSHVMVKSWDASPFADLREGNLQALLGGSSYIAPPPPMAAPDPFISSLIYTLPLDESSKDAQSDSLDEGNIVSKNSEEKVVKRLNPT